MPPDCEEHVVSDLPTVNIENLAKYAKSASSQFRKDACKRGDFVKIVHAVLKDNKNPPFQCLTREEVLFCEGWIYLAQNEFLDSNGAVDDGKLLTAIKKHVPDSGLTPFTG